ncbi:MAG: FAD-binding oxidoreductase [Acidobacteria bacterium]|nr:FAD-binding oxidoreductase [Acidobacteriota bacterium]
MAQSTFAGQATSLIVNDVHSQLNETQVRQIFRPTTVAELQATIRAAKAAKCSVSIAGGRHAMGGQQFCSGHYLIDMSGLNRVISFDSVRGLIEVEAGMFWPGFMSAYLGLQKHAPVQWGFAQKQTGVDDVSIGGSLAANAHGRGLTMRPFISNVESFKIVDADGNLVSCSRQENSELFRLAIGGYGLFGVVSSVTLRLVPRQKIQRVVEVRTTGGLMDAFAQRIRDGFSFGDFQFAIDSNSEDFLHNGVFSCYRAVDPETPIRDNQYALSDENWRKLLYLAHVDKTQAFRCYADHYRSTDGQIYWSDSHQMSIYPASYHAEIDERQQATCRATEMITEINVPREELEPFLAEVREDFRKNRVHLIYGTIRIIEKDDESFLPWATQSYACTIFNLHTVHTPEGIEHSAEAFRRLIDMAVRRNGTYYLTYHRFARRDQVLACYPNFEKFLELKRKYDPTELFQSDWYRHYREMFANRA